MKKMNFVLMLIFLTVIILGCKAQSPPLPQDNIVSNSVSTQPANSKKSDGIIYTVNSAEVKKIAGDLAGDGSSLKDGGYFTYHGDILKSGDYKNLIITYTIENTTDRAFGYINNGWSIELADGYKVLVTSDISDLKLNQVLPKSSKQIVMETPIAGSLNPDKVILKYGHMDYNEEFWNDVGEIMLGRMTQQQCDDKYGDKIKSIEITAPTK